MKYKTMYRILKEYNKKQLLIHIVTLFEITHLLCINYDMFTIMYHVVFIYINIMSAYYIYINQTYNDISKKYSYLKKSGICIKRLVTAGSLVNNM